MPCRDASGLSPLQVSQPGMAASLLIVAGAIEMAIEAGLSLKVPLH
ncbi:MAG: hypothetical protein HYS05_08700 [Acidobacteria bacterium]|nr:hypothetical protein [Acidobacteriota bacterium]